MHSKSQISEIIIDHNGDVMLELGESHLLVSSKVLSLVSPVFAAMFKPQFKEGIQSHSSSNGPSKIPLPEDDAKAFTLLCNVIHYRVEEIPGKPDIPCIENLAIICNKYGCIRALAHSGALWLRALSKDAPYKDLSKLLLVAYILDLPDMFSRISWEVMQLQAGPFIDVPGLAGHPLVPHNLLSMLELFADSAFIELIKPRGIQREKSRTHSGLIESNNRTNFPGTTRHL